MLIDDIKRSLLLPYEVAVKMKDHFISPEPVAEDEVRLDFWLPCIGYSAVTMIFDGLMEHLGHSDIFVGIVVDDTCPASNYINTGTIEEMSSGFKLLTQINDPKSNIILLRGSEKALKPVVTVRNDLFDGFFWNENAPNKPGQRQVPTSSFGGKYVLNFTVSGEFNASVYVYDPRTNKKFIAFSKSFSCK